MEIQNVEMSEKNGVTITFTSYDPVNIGSKLFILLHGMEHYFEVKNITVNEKNIRLFHYKAKEVGSWYRRFEKMKDFDIRNLLNVELHEITNIDKIKEINKQSCQQ